MASGIYTKVKLHPFYQEFLRGYFQQHELVFKFPKKHDLLTRLEQFVSIQPENRETDWISDKDCNAFLIELPYMEHKDPFYYNYISQNKSRLYAHRVREFFRDVYHEFVGRLERDGFYREEIIYIFLEEFHISPDYTDWLKKELYLYKKSLSARKHRKKRKKSHKLN